MKTKARKKAEQPWKMPKWMEPYRGYICNTGGNSIEEIMNMDENRANLQVNAPLAIICVAVKSQVALLETLKDMAELRSKEGW